MWRRVVAMMVPSAAATTVSAAGLRPMWRLHTPSPLQIRSMHAGCDPRSDMASLDDNIRFIKYSSDVSARWFYVAEVVNIDSVFDHCTKHSLPEPFGIQVWDSAYKLANLIENSFPEGMAGLRVADLGCGNGLVSILCASMGATVLALDYNPISHALLRHGVRKFCEDHPRTPLGVIHCQVFNMAKTSARLPDCDLLLLSDMLYTKEMGTVVAKRIVEALEREFSVLIMDPIRSTTPHFLNTLHELLGSTESLRHHLCDAVFQKTSGREQVMWLNKAILRNKCFLRT